MPLLQLTIIQINVYLVASKNTKSRMKRASGIRIFNTLHAGHKAGALRQRKTLAAAGGII
jgi:hypothetical protein